MAKSFKYYRANKGPLVVVVVVVIVVVVVGRKGTVALFSS